MNIFREYGSIFCFHVDRKTSFHPIIKFRRSPMIFEDNSAVMKPSLSNNLPEKADLIAIFLTV